MEQNLNFNVGEMPPFNTVQVLQGTALAPVNLQPVEVKGNVFAVMDYVASREKHIDRVNSHIVFNEEKRTCILTVDENSPLKKTVTATLEKYPELEEFGINTNKYFTRAEMEKLIRMKRFFFLDKDSHSSLVARFKTFSAKIDASLTESKDNRSNKSNHFEKAVQTDLPPDFALSIPIFKGYTAANFRVEICYDVTDSNVRFWLESVELFEIEREDISDQFTIQSEKLRDLNFTVIHQ